MGTENTVAAETKIKTILGAERFFDGAKWLKEQEDRRKSFLH